MGKRAEKERWLRAVWDHGAPIGEAILPTAWCFVPVPMLAVQGWGVWDRVSNRFINDEEILGYSVESLATETVPSLTN